MNMGTGLDRNIWEQLLSLEDVDITQQWFKLIHKKSLSLRRTKEINASAKQAREYFRNAKEANFSVKPLLTYYGVASLSRSLILLLKPKSGEESLTSGHGITTVNWDSCLSGDPINGLRNLGSLLIQPCSGLFSDFVNETKNQTFLHVSSDAIDWKISYDIPPHNLQISFNDIHCRTPDLYREYSNISSDIKYSYVSSIKIDKEQKNVSIQISKKNTDNFINTYTNLGFKSDLVNELIVLYTDFDTFEKITPMLINSYIHRSFDLIPNLYISDLFNSRYSYSQLSMAFMISYILGMLVRYYPSHWISLLQGSHGDFLWPTINRSQYYIENIFPELVLEMIFEIIKKSKLADNA